MIKKESSGSPDPLRRVPTRKTDFIVKTLPADVIERSSKAPANLAPGLFVPSIHKLLAPWHFESLRSSRLTSTVKYHPRGHVGRPWEIQGFFMVELPSLHSQSSAVLMPVRFNISSCYFWASARACSN